MTNKKEREGISVGRAATIATLAAFLTIFLASMTLNLENFAFVELASAQEVSDAGASSQTTLTEWHVFLVAANAYDVGVRKLRYCENDVRDLKAIFKALGVKDENIVVLSTENEEYSEKPYKESIDDRYNEFIAGLTENSIAFVFLSGHGFCVEENGKKYSYYAPADWQSGKLDKKAVSIDDMMKKLDGSKAHFKWMCVDACRTILKRSAGESSLSIDKAPKGIVLMQSCDSGQYSYEAGRRERAPFENGLFTRAFIDAISSRAQDADVDGDGRVSLGELCGYVAKRVPSDARQYCGNAKQNPIVTPFNNSSLDDFSKYVLFEDSEWREGQLLRADAESLAEQGKYAEALEKIKEAVRRLPNSDEIKQKEKDLQQLLDEHNVMKSAEEYFRRAEKAFDNQNYHEALGFIDKAVELNPGNNTYDVYREVIRLAIGQLTDPTPSPQPLEPPTDFNQPEPTEPFAEELPSVGGQAGASRTVTINGVKVVFRWCPPGEFMMGSPLNEINRSANETQHKVVITKGFWLAETETTQALWKAVMGKGNNPSKNKGDNLPVNSVSWDDCQEFIKKLNEQAKSTGLRFRLPSEAHWEYACRAGTTTRYFWGDEWDSSRANDRSSTKRVGSYSANAWGLKDMHGNVSEWCEDWYGDYPTGTVTDPAGPQSGSLRVLRGGGWSHSAGNCRSASRNWSTPGILYSLLGFRLEGDDMMVEQISSSSTITETGEVSNSISSPVDSPIGENTSSDSAHQTTNSNSSTNLTPSNGNESAGSSSPKAGASRTVTINGVDVVFRWCPPGEFMMGSPENEEGRNDSERRHKVVITKGFWLAETETTQALWKAVMGKDNNPSDKKGDNLPVEQVSWNDCQEFIKKLNEQAKSTGLVFRLPSEAHWEYACRAGTTTPFSFGSILNGDKANCDGNYPYGTNTKGKYVEETTPVGSYSANAWGLKDMHGNVWEWCEDRYGDYPAGTVTDPTGPQNGSDRVSRGGGWYYDARYCRSANRDRRAPAVRNRILGFRLEGDDMMVEQISSSQIKPEVEDSGPVAPPRPASFKVTVDPVPTDPKAGASRTVTINGVDVVFRWCPPGEFMMGSPSNEKDRDDDETQHKVVITKGFWLAETETTQALWKAVMGEDNNPSLFMGDNLPVEQVSWNDCQEFISKLNEQAKSTELVFRLPSEAHWEYACRAGTTTRYFWGDGWDSSRANHGSSTKPVGSYSANAWGLKDMHGNVLEWCEDRYGDYPSGTVTDPTGPQNGSDRVFRGGGWRNDARYCRSANRSGYLPVNRDNSLGFRLELDDSSSN
ncbi:MAG: SUMF1/EgtB/PvdO family nonheme iron enzyme [Thermoguttaceae bacterium]|nr:SUMF1/EgtB/PvdO family nonheme iron enzyme [Thermoguttaceae bacterium]